jgi:hypothetical protein
MQRFILQVLALCFAAATVQGCTHASGFGGRHPSTRDPSVPTRSNDIGKSRRQASTAADYERLLVLHREGGEAKRSSQANWTIDSCRTACRRSVQICDLQQHICDDADSDPTDENVENCREAQGYCKMATRDCVTCSERASEDSPVK